MLLLALAALAGCGQKGITPIQTAFNKGVYHYGKGNYDDAIAEYRDALEANPRDHRARFNLAVTLETKADRADRRGQHDVATRLRADAEQEYRNLLAQKPDDLRASINLSAVEYERGQRTDAMARLSAIAEHYPNVALPKTALAAHLLREAQEAGASAESTRLLEEARGLLERALNPDPSNVATLMVYGDVLLALDDPARARRSYQRALKREPSDVATLLALGRLELNQGNPTEASAWLQRALYIDPDHFEAHVLMAEAREEAGDLESAVRHLWEARRLDDGANPHASPDYRERLASLYVRLLAAEGTPDE
jgi:tetratricopeptide (TPR) repeat protein